MHSSRLVHTIGGAFVATIGALLVLAFAAGGAGTAFAQEELPTVPSAPTIPSDQLPTPPDAGGVPTPPAPPTVPDGGLPVPPDGGLPMPPDGDVPTSLPPGTLPGDGDDTESSVDDEPDGDDVADDDADGDDTAVAEVSEPPASEAADTTMSATEVTRLANAGDGWRHNIDDWAAAAVVTLVAIGGSLTSIAFRMRHRI